MAKETHLNLKRSVVDTFVHTRHFIMKPSNSSLDLNTHTQRHTHRPDPGQIHP